MRFAGRGNHTRYFRTGNTEPVQTVEAQRGRHSLPTTPIQVAHRVVKRDPRRTRRFLGIASALVAIGVVTPVAAYACGFDPVHVRPAVEKTLAQFAGDEHRLSQRAVDRRTRSADTAAHETASTGATAVPAQQPSSVAVSTPPVRSVSSSSGSTSSAAPTSPASPVDAGTGGGGDGRFGLPLYDNPRPIADAARLSIASVLSQVAAKTTLGTIASYPMGQWFVDGHAGFANDVAQAVDGAAAKRSVATLVAYDIPHRDCGAYSAGGASSADAYRSWIRSFVGGLGSHKAIIVIEPDAIGLAPNCLSASQRAERYSLIKYAVEQFEAQGSWAYIDAGNSAWLSVPDVTTALKASGIAEATGFALNTAQSRSDSELIPYGDKVSAAVGGKHYVIDSSRNGIAPKPGNYDWCNPSDKGLGHRPTADTGHSLLDAFLWIKTPGGSDGSCNGAPGAGAWFPSYASMLLANAHLNG